MSATLTWASSGLGAKSGTTNAALIDDIVALVNSKSGDANFAWEVASSNNGASPLYVVLKRKDASVGRILLVIWSSAPAGNNAAILDQGPTTNVLYGAYFPSGNVDSPSNLTAASGTILGDDSGAVKVWATLSVSVVYSASIQFFYFDSAEAVVFCFQNPASSTVYMGAAGALVVDASDNAYDAVMSYGSSSLIGFGAASSVMAWTSAATNAGTSTPCVRTNYGAANRVYFHAFAPSSAWAASAISSTDILSDTGNSRVYFVPQQLLGQAKGEGFVLRLRQIAMGPGTLGALTPYNETGPVVVARQMNALTTGGNGYPWMTNFKL